MVERIKRKVMKTMIWILVLTVVLGAGCKEKKAEEIPGWKLNPATGILMEDESVWTVTDTVVYEDPITCLCGTDTIKPGEASDIGMRAEREVYDEGLEYVRVFVDNPTNTPLIFGTAWNVEIWRDGTWMDAEKHQGGKKVIFPLIASVSMSGHLRYDFCFPVKNLYVMRPGRYRLVKSFSAGKKDLKLSAEFTVRAK